MFRLCAFVLTLSLCGGCTLSRIENDTSQALQWLRLKPGSDIHTDARWLLPAQARIRVVELAPAPDAAWTAAAQAGVNAVFMPFSSPMSEEFQLLVSWPGTSVEVPPAQYVSLWEILALEQFRPRLQDPLALQVALIRSADGALVKTARLDVTPRWFATPASGPALVRHAFEDLAASLSPAY